jgi:hypothetical protein
MSDVLWMNIPLMVAFLGLTAGIPLWFVLRHSSWHGKPEAHAVPAYLASAPAPRRTARSRRTEPIRVPSAIRVERTIAAR